MECEFKSIIPINLTNSFCNINAAAKTLSNNFYKLANIFIDQKMLDKGLDCYCDAFLLRNLSIEESDKQFIDFFKVQFTIYQLGKKRVAVALCEGDMVYDLIAMEWQRIQQQLDESPFEIDERGLHEWYKNIEIDFPWIDLSHNIEM